MHKLKLSMLCLGEFGCCNLQIKTEEWWIWHLCYLVKLFSISHCTPICTLATPVIVFYGFFRVILQFSPMMKEWVLTSIKVQVRNYEHRRRLTNYSCERSSASVLWISLLIFFLFWQILQGGPPGMDNGLHKAMRKESRHMETDQVCEMWISFM